MTGATPAKVMVIGIGNPDRGDDGIGAEVARMLAGRLPAEASIATRAGDMLALIEDWAGVDALICIDAVAPNGTSMGAPGCIHRLDLATEELPRDFSFASSHAMGLADAIALARRLKLAPRDFIVYGVEGRCFDHGAPLTAAVAAAAAAVAERVVAEVARLRNPEAEAAAHA